MKLTVEQFQKLAALEKVEFVTEGRVCPIFQYTLLLVTGHRMVIFISQDMLNNYLAQHGWEAFTQHIPVELAKRMYLDIADMYKGGEVTQEQYDTLRQIDPEGIDAALASLNSTHGVKNA